MLTEKNIPTDPQKWAYYKSQAKKKFDVYPSAYANAWAAKKYKAAGGGWRKDENEEVEEGTTTASAGGEYQTPNAFAGSKKKWRKQVPREYSEPSLYYEHMLKKLQTLINEISYNEFKSDDSSTQKQKINNSIKEISTQLYKMEQTLNQISKLKTEINGDQRIFYKSTFSKFGKISERILRLGNKIRELSK
jgi:hypothetical protein